MADTITLEIALDGFVRPDTKRRWIAVCPSIGVTSQGTSAADAKRCLKEAVEAWFESCIERGVLDQAMRESNFRPLALAGSPQTQESDVRGELFPIKVAIPAYQAAAYVASA